MLLLLQLHYAVRVTLNLRQLAVAINIFLCVCRFGESVSLPINSAGES